jgi:hypothetical protein
MKQKAHVGLSIPKYPFTIYIKQQQQKTNKLRNPSSHFHVITVTRVKISAFPRNNHKNQAYKDLHFPVQKTR